MFGYKGNKFELFCSGILHVPLLDYTPLLSKFCLYDACFYIIIWIFIILITVTSSTCAENWTKKHISSDLELRYEEW
jgi:hypothetical protein